LECNPVNDRNDTDNLTRQGIDVAHRSDHLTPTSSPLRVAMSVAVKTSASAWLAFWALARTVSVNSPTARVVCSSPTACDSVQVARSELPLVISVLAPAIVSAKI
jgi:hypothetical protein